MEQLQNKKKLVHTGDGPLTDTEFGDGPLTEFLRRLPLKSLFKFKCVSKRWFSLISDPSMPRLYIPRPDMPKHTLLCLHTYPIFGEVFVKIESHPKFESVNFKLGFSPKEPEDFRIVAADKGLLLSCELSGSRQPYYVSNPLTGQWTGLPEPALTKISEHDVPMIHYLIFPPGSMYVPRGVGLAGGDGSIYQPRGIGFIVGPGLDYKVIRIRHFECTNHLELDLFDSRNGQWRSCKVLMSHPVQKLFDRLVPGVLYKGALHWAVDSPSFDFGKVVVYDPTLHESQGNNYTCRVFDCPPPRGQYGEGALGLSGGEMRYADFSSPNNARESRILCVWLLKDYDSAEWCLEYEIPESELMEGFPFPCDCLYVWDFDPVDKDTMYFCVTNYQCGPLMCVTLASYDILGRKMTLLCNHNSLPLASTPARLSTFSFHRYTNRINGRAQTILGPSISAVPFALSSWPTPL